MHAPAEPENPEIQVDSNDEPRVESEPLETWTVAQPNPNGGAGRRGEVRGLPVFTFAVPTACPHCRRDTAAGDVIERSVRVHSVGVVTRGRATLWRRAIDAPLRELHPTRRAPDEPAPETIPAPPGDAAAVIVRQEVEVLAERRRDLRRDCDSLEARRDSLQREVDGLVAAKGREMETLGATLETLAAQNNRILGEMRAATVEQMDHNNRLIRAHNVHAAEQLRGAWDLEVAQQAQRRQVTTEIAAQAEDIGKIRQQLHSSIWTDRLGDFLREGRLAFKDAVNSPLGQALQMRVAAEIEKDLAGDGQKVTRQQVLDAMIFNASGTRLRVDVLRRLATARASDPTAQALAFAASWFTGELGNDPQCVDDFVAARAQKVTT